MEAFGERDADRRCAASLAMNRTAKAGQEELSGGHRRLIFLGLAVEGLLASRTAEVDIASFVR